MPSRDHAADAATRAASRRAAALHVGRFAGARRSERGATTLEYGLSLAFLALAVVAALGPLGERVGALVERGAGVFP